MVASIDPKNAKNYRHPADVPGLWTPDLGAMQSDPRSNKDEWVCCEDCSRPTQNLGTKLCDMDYERRKQEGDTAFLNRKAMQEKAMHKLTTEYQINQGCQE